MNDDYTRESAHCLAPRRTFIITWGVFSAWILGLWAKPTPSNKTQTSRVSWLRRCGRGGLTKPGAKLFHVLNRAVGPATIFEKATDYAAFEQVFLTGYSAGNTIF